MLRPRFAFALTALALAIGCGGDDDPAVRSNNLAFEGVAWVVPDEAGKLVVAWKPAPDAQDYRVYITRLPGRELKTIPIKTDGTAVTITPEKQGERYYVIVRAADASGLEDRNTIVKSAIASPDTAPPSFNGLKTAEPSGNAGARLTWEPATDDFTPPEAIVYDVYAGRPRTTLTRIARTGPGDTTITLNELGVPREPFVFEVRARDIANNESAGGAVVNSALGQDATLPTFAGCDAATALGATSVEVTWSPATDNHSPASELTYEVFTSTSAGQFDFTADPAAKVSAATAVTLTGLQPGVTYSFVCRARDAAGNAEENTVERSATTASDVTKPTFAGIKGFDFDPVMRKVKLSWDPATDDQTPPGNIVYDVFEARTAGGYDFDAPPRATSAPGAPYVELSDLASRATLNWVVRARDATNNRDDNLVERSGTTDTSYSIDVQGVFNKNCAVVGCHVSGPTAGGLNLAPAFSYDQLVDARSILGNIDGRNIPRVTKSNLQESWLSIKINPNPPRGLVMPAPQTGNALTAIEKDIITSWIMQDAPRN
ncbi:MAG: fibronectin type III domain-containing protein [Labilithrix sp.]|nr:fibronectin type III domain-containing protein [Labilithrix sp.]MCW5814999.1 fibronectin type III domain-containing protein [Labilithrix sp.]